MDYINQVVTEAEKPGTWARYKERDMETEKRMGQEKLGGPINCCPTVHLASGISYQKVSVGKSLFSFRLVTILLQSSHLQVWISLGSANFLE